MSFRIEFPMIWNRIEALVALNHDYDEQNMTTETVFVGPEQRPVTVWRLARDNEPDRLPDEGRQHQIAALWQINWISLSGYSDWTGVLDDELRPAIVTSNMPGAVRFNVPDNARLWVPAGALYGYDAISGLVIPGDSGSRWIEVCEDDVFRLGFGSSGMMAPFYGMGIPVVIEGVATGTGEIAASFTALDERHVNDAVTIHVVAVDLDVDSDNSDQLGTPERSVHEEQLEDEVGAPGKRLLVNSDDVDRDNIPDFLDGFDLDGQEDSPGSTGLDDNQVGVDEQLGFVPVVIELPPLIDPLKALLRFSYDSSDPLAATIESHGARHLAEGSLRLWTVDEWQPRRPQAANDPVNPGHFVAPYKQTATGLSTHQLYRVSQLTGGHPVGEFTLYLEAVQAGHFTLSVEVDPDGIPDLVADGNGNLVPQYIDLFQGFAMHDVIAVTAESEVIVSAVNAIGAESHDLTRPDVAAFEVRRNSGDLAEELMVYYRVLFDAEHEYAGDPVIDAARGDFEVVKFGGPSAGLADDPVTRIGSVLIAGGQSKALITVVPRDDRVVEWDELVSIELISWDEYRGLHDQDLVVTPNDGLPRQYNAWPWWDDRSPYRLRTGRNGDPTEHTATATLLDNDRASSWGYEQPDQESTGLVAEKIGYGFLEVDLRGGQAQVELPVWSPQYREDHNLYPVAEVVLQLPEEHEAITSLTGVYTVAGFSGTPVTFDTAELGPYLEPNAGREVRLVLRGADGLTTSLASGHYDHDICLAADVGGKSVTRTIRGTTDVVNRVDATLGTPEFGQNWTLDELDRLVPYDGISSGGRGQPLSRLTPLGARSESGMAVVRGDNSVSPFRARWAVIVRA